MNAQPGISRPKIWSSEAVAIVCVALAVFFAYLNVYNNQFLFDDEFLIQKNSFLRSWSSIFEIFRSSSTTGSGGVDSFYRPMQTLAYLFIFQIFGLSTFGFHLLNVSLHAINSCLVYRLGRKLGFLKGAAFCAAVIWGVHPIHTEAVTYMSATADALYALFCLLGCVVLLPNFSGRRVLAATLIFACGLMSKESAIVFPALALITRFVSLGPNERWNWRKYTFTWPFWAFAILYVIARKTFLNFDDAFHFYKQANIYTENIGYRILTFFATIPDYIEVFVWPVGLHMERSFPVFVDIMTPQVLLGLVIFLTTLIVAAWQSIRRGAVALSFGLLWFWIAHSPHTGILLPVNSFFLEHWLYLPSTGLLLGITQTAGIWAQSRKVIEMSLATLAMITACALTYRTIDQNAVWSNPIRFYSNIIAHDSKSARVHNNLAMALSEAGRDEEAGSQYLEAIQISDQYPQSHYNLALLYIKHGSIEDGEKQLLRALEINPDFYQACGKLHDLYLAEGKTALAQEWAEKFLATRKRLGF